MTYEETGKGNSRLITRNMIKKGNVENEEC